MVSSNIGSVVSSYFTQLCNLNEKFARSLFEKWFPSIDLTRFSGKSLNFFNWVSANILLSNDRILLGCKLKKVQLIP